MCPQSLISLLVTAIPMNNREAGREFRICPLWRLCTPAWAAGLLCPWEDASRTIMSQVPCTKPEKALQTHSCVASGRSGHGLLGQSHDIGPGTSVCLYSSDNFIGHGLGKDLHCQDEKQALIIPLMWWVQFCLGNVQGSSGKETCSWHHHSLSCKLFRANYSSSGVLPLLFPSGLLLHLLFHRSWWHCCTSYPWLFRLSHSPFWHPPWFLVFGIRVYHTIQQANLSWNFRSLGTTLTVLCSTHANKFLCVLSKYHFILDSSNF